MTTHDGHDSGFSSMSLAGERWSAFYQSKELSWFDPGKTDRTTLERFSKSEWITRMLDHTKIKPSGGVKILEAGCGTGTYAVTLALLGFKVDAFDYNEKAVAIADQLIKKIQIDSPLLAPRIYHGNLLNIQAPSNTYDFVFNQAVLEYFCDENERAKAIQEMIRVSKPGGWVGVIVQHTAHPFRPLWKYLGWPGYTNQPPVIDYSPLKLKEDFERAGMTDIRGDGIYPWNAFFWWPKWYQKWKWSENLVYLIGRGLGRFFPLPLYLRAKLSMQILVMGRKK